MESNAGAGQLLSNALKLAGPLSWKGMKGCNYKEEPLEKQGAIYQYIEEAMQISIRTHRGNRGGKFTSYKISGIRRILCQSGIDRYNSYRDLISRTVGSPNERLLFHGTRNIETITTKGFDKSEADPSGMFGSGFYFADLSSKANQYASDSDSRQLLLCRVNMGKTMKHTKSVKYDTAPSGYQSVTGVPSPGGLKYKEFVVYKKNQVYPEFVITYTLQ